MKQEIWMASYLIKERFKLFKKALKSFNDQTLAAPVVISVCGQEAWRAAIWAREILTRVPYEIQLREERLSQFDQLYMILTTRPKNRDILYISVCDDDDWFAPDRILVQQRYIDTHSSDIPLPSFRCHTIGKKFVRDFGCFCFTNKQLEQFFDKPSDPTIAPDIFFMAGLRWIDIDEELYGRTSSIYTRKYNELRPDGSKWFTINKCQKSSTLTIQNLSNN